MRIPAALVPFIAFILIPVACGGGEDAGHGRDEITERPNVLLIIIDTLRADHLSCYGYHRNTSPAIDSLALAGTRWENCQSQAPWTPPAVASIMSGLTAREHGVGRHSDGDHGLHPEMPFMPMLFSDAGYRTCGIFNVAHMTVLHGYARGFDHHTCNEEGDVRAAVSIDELLQWLDSSDPDMPFLAVLHLFDPHHPYDPPEAYKGLYIAGDTVTATRWELSEDGTAIAHPEHLEHFLAWYDGEISYTDDELSRLFGEIRTRGYGDNTVVFLTADHGEEFLERGWIEHGHQLYREMIHVPLVASGPGIPSGHVVAEHVGNFDVLPTLLALCGIETDAEFSGTDLLSDPPPPSRPIPAGRQMAMGEMLGGLPVAAVEFDGMKGVVIRDGDTDSYFMFDLIADPAEIEPMPADSRMVEMLDYYRSTPALYESLPLRDLEQSTLEALRDLGYI